MFMLLCEINAWSCWAAVESVAAVERAGIVALADWPRRIQQPAELEALEPFTARGLIYPGVATQAAGDAAVELAIVVSIWPESLDDILRPSLRRVR